LSSQGVRSNAGALTAGQVETLFTKESHCISHWTCVLFSDL